MLFAQFKIQRGDKSTIDLQCNAVQARIVGSSCDFFQRMIFSKVNV